MSLPESFFSEKNSSLFLIHFLFLFFLIGAGIFVFYQYYIESEHDICTVTTVLVSAAKSNICQGEILTLENVGFQRIPPHHISSKIWFWKDRNHLLGRIALVPISPQEFFTESQLTSYSVFELIQLDIHFFHREKIFCDLQEIESIKKKTILALKQLEAFLKQNLPILLKLAQDPDEEVQKSVQNALQRVLGITLEESQEKFLDFPQTKEGSLDFGSILRGLHLEKGAQRKESALFLAQLADLKNREFSRLFTLLNNPEGEIRESARNALKELLGETSVK
jgi:hypothetical protein